MNMIDKMINESYNQAGLRNAEVLIDAIGELPHCPNCNYPQNHVKFDLLLREHTRNKISIHKYSIREIYSKYYDVHYNDVYIKLKKIWPCEDCIETYNPSKRKNHFPKQSPIKQGVLDV